MLESMTGFSETAGTAGNTGIRVSLKSVNGRNLHIHTACNIQCLALEEEAYGLLKKTFDRGSISLQINIGRDPFNAGQLRTLARHAKEIPAGLNPTAELGSVIRAARLGAENAPIPAAVIKKASALLRKTVKGLQNSRRAEGDSLADELTDRAIRIETALKKLQKEIPSIEKKLKLKLRESIKAVLSDENVTVSNNDIAREIAIRVEKADISEEVNRGLLHTATLQKTVSSRSVTVGKKLDFLCQELHREVNTLGVKIRDTSRAERVIDIKTDIEKLREQVQNVQ